MTEIRTIDTTPLAPLPQQFDESVIQELQFHEGGLRKPVVEKKIRKSLKEAIPHFLEEIGLPEKYTGFVYLVVDRAGDFMQSPRSTVFSLEKKLSKQELEKLRTKAKSKSVLRNSILSAAIKNCLSSRFPEQGITFKRLPGYRYKSFLEI